MKQILHLVSGEGEHVRLAERVIELERATAQQQITVIHLNAEPSSTDYRELLHAIFKADSIHAW